MKMLKNAIGVPIYLVPVALSLAWRQCLLGLALVHACAALGAMSKRGAMKRETVNYPVLNVVPLESTIIAWLPAVEGYGVLDVAVVMWYAKVYHAVASSGCVVVGLQKEVTWQCRRFLGMN
jgi:hypothetical protein